MFYNMLNFCLPLFEVFPLAFVKLLGLLDLFAMQKLAAEDVL